MKLIDTNILIYSGESRYASVLIPFVTDFENCISVVSYVETLGFHRITAAQIAYFESVFRILQRLPINDLVIEQAVKIRQMKKMSLGDALIAATALVQGVDIVSRNSADFSGIPGLTVINPIP